MQGTLHEGTKRQAKLRFCFSAATGDEPSSQANDKLTRHNRTDGHRQQQSQRPTLHQKWKGFMGEKLEHHNRQPHIFSIWKSTMIGRSSMKVEVHNAKSPTLYQIEGSFSKRSCTIYHMLPSSSDDHGTYSKVSMAEIKRKVESTRKVVLGRDVFSLVVKAGFDAAFSMGLVLALDRIDGHDATSIDGHEDVGT